MHTFTRLFAITVSLIAYILFLGSVFTLASGVFYMSNGGTMLIFLIIVLYASAGFLSSFLMQRWGQIMGEE